MKNQSINMKENIRKKDWKNYRSNQIKRKTKQRQDNQRISFGHQAKSKLFYFRESFVNSENFWMNAKQKMKDSLREIFDWENTFVF